MADDQNKPRVPPSPAMNQQQAPLWGPGGGVDPQVLAQMQKISPQQVGTVPQGSPVMDMGDAQQFLANQSAGTPQPPGMRIQPAAQPQQGPPNPGANLPPVFNSFDQFLKTQVAPWQQDLRPATFVPAGGVEGMAGMGTWVNQGPTMKESAMADYAKLMGIQQAQQGLNQQGAAAMGNLGVAAGHLGLAASAQQYQQNPQTAAMAGTLQALQGHIQARAAQGLDPDPSFVLAAQQLMGQATGAPAQQAPGGLGGAALQTGGGPAAGGPQPLPPLDLATAGKIKQLGKDPRAALDFIVQANGGGEKGMAAVARQWPAIRAHLTAANPNALTTLRSGIEPGFLGSIGGLQYVGQAAAGALHGLGGGRVSFYTPQGRANLTTQATKGVGENFRAMIGAPSQEDTTNEMIRALLTAGQ